MSEGISKAELYKILQVKNFEAFENDILEKSFPTKKKIKETTIKKKKKIDIKNEDDVEKMFTNEREDSQVCGFAKQYIKKTDKVTFTQQLKKEVEKRLIQKDIEHQYRLHPDQEANFIIKLEEHQHIIEIFKSYTIDLLYYSFKNAPKSSDSFFTDVDFSHLYVEAETFKNYFKDQIILWILEEKEALKERIPLEKRSLILKNIFKNRELDSISEEACSGVLKLIKKYAPFSFNRIIHHGIEIAYEKGVKESESLQKIGEQSVLSIRKKAKQEKEAWLANQGMDQEGTPKKISKRTIHPPLHPLNTPDFVEKMNTLSSIELAQNDFLSTPPESPNQPMHFSPYQDKQGDIPIPANFQTRP